MLIGDWFYELQANGTVSNDGRQSIEMEGPAAERKKMHAELTDEERWAVDRTGWAPQFEQEHGDTDEGEATLLDHQTWIESKLDDKYFGGMYCSHFFRD